MQARKTAIIAALTLLTTIAAAQQSHWAKPDDPTAKYIIDHERLWAEDACTHNGVAKDMVAEDFQGTSTGGVRYTRADEIRDEAGPITATKCHLDDAKVHFFSENVAVVYGSERRVKKNKQGKDELGCQIWTDTWLKRDGKWQVVAAQDAPIACK